MDSILYNSVLHQPQFYNSHNEILINNQQEIQSKYNINNFQNNTNYKKQKILNTKQCETEIITAEEHGLNIKDSPVYFLGLLLDADIISWLISEISCQSSHIKNFTPVTEAEIRCFIAILYLSGYVDVPRRRMLWERAPDTHCSLVSNAMQRDRFEAIFKAIHMTDSFKDVSKFCKLKSFVDLLNNKFLCYSPKDDQHSIAECFISTNNKQSSKTVTKVLKVWCGCTKNGYCVWFDPCQNQISDELNFARSVIVNYAHLLQRHKPGKYSLLFDNTYNEMQLIYDLQKVGVQGSAIDRDRTKCLLNPALGGVDRMDANVNLYRISVRGKKCYSTIISYILDITLHNAWQLYKASVNEKKQLDLLGFRRNIVVYYLQHYAKPILGHQGGRPTKIRIRGKRPPPSDARFDGIRHYVIPQEKQTRCAKCTAKTTTRCQKCDVGVHVKCFVDYHQRPREIFRNEHNN